MKKLPLTLLATSCMLALTACGGGGSSTTSPTPTVSSGSGTTTGGTTTGGTTGSGSSQQPNDSALKATLQNTFGESGNARRTPEMQQFGTGTLHNSVLILDNTSKTAKAEINPDEGSYSDYTVRALETISIGGERVVLSNFNTELKSSNGGSKFKDGFVAAYSDRVLFGGFNDVSGDNTYLFVQGVPISSTYIKDATGTYNFTGHALFGKDGKYEALNNAVSASVDLGSKAVNVGLKLKDDSLNFSGALVENEKGFGNIFFGDKGDGIMKGGIFGTADSKNNIHEMQVAGFFDVTKEGQYKGYNGVFGADLKK